MLTGAFVAAYLNEISCITFTFDFVKRSKSLKNTGNTYPTI